MFMKDNSYKGDKDNSYEFTAFTQSLDPAMHSNVHGVVNDERQQAISVRDDREVNINIPRTPEGTNWAYENDEVVFNSCERYDSIINNGFVVKIYDEDENGLENVRLKDKKAKAYVEYMINNVWELQTKLSAMIKNRFLNGIGACKKFNLYSKKDKKKFERLAPHKMKLDKLMMLAVLDTMNVRPIVDSETGLLGGPRGQGVNQAQPDMEVALVQRAKIASYSPIGVPIYMYNFFYLTEDQLLYINNSDRGKFIGKPPVERILRWVEIKISIKNAIDLAVKRYGPQVWIIVGNEKVNLTNSEIPRQYMTDSTGKPVDSSTARAKFKQDVFNNIQNNIQKWANGETLTQIAEWGTQVQSVNPSSGLPDYKTLLDVIDNRIKLGILGVDMPGRVDVTSSVMQETLNRDIRDKAQKDRDIIINRLNRDLINPALELAGFERDSVYLEFNPLSLTNEMEQVELEFKKSDTIYNYKKSGFNDIPDYLKHEWNIVPEKLGSQVNEQNEQSNEDNEGDMRTDTDGVKRPPQDEDPSDKMRRDISKGR